MRERSTATGLDGASRSHAFTPSSPRRAKPQKTDARRIHSLPWRPSDGTGLHLFVRWRRGSGVSGGGGAIAGRIRLGSAGQQETEDHPLPETDGPVGLLKRMKIVNETAGRHGDRLRSRSPQPEEADKRQCDHCRSFPPPGMLSAVHNSRDEGISVWLALPCRRIAGWL